MPTMWFQLSTNKKNKHTVLSHINVIQSIPPRVILYRSEKNVRNSKVMKQCWRYFFQILSFYFSSSNITIFISSTIVLYQILYSRNWKQCKHQPKHCDSVFFLTSYRWKIMDWRKIFSDFFANVSESTITDNNCDS